MASNRWYIVKQVNGATMEERNGEYRIMWGANGRGGFAGSQSFGTRAAAEQAWTEKTAQPEGVEPRPFGAAAYRDEIEPRITTEAELMRENAKRVGFIK